MISNKQFPTKKIEFRNQNSPVVRAPLDEHFVSIEEKQVSSKSKKQLRTEITESFSIDVI